MTEHIKAKIVKGWQKVNLLKMIGKKEQIRPEYSFCHHINNIEMIKKIAVWYKYKLNTIL